MISIRFWKYKQLIMIKLLQINKISVHMKIWYAVNIHVRICIYFCYIDEYTRVFTDLVQRLLFSTNLFTYIILREGNR